VQIKAYDLPGEKEGTRTDDLPGCGKFRSGRNLVLCMFSTLERRYTREVSDRITLKTGILFKKCISEIADHRLSHFHLFEWPDSIIKKTFDGVFDMM
jgi:hypothetical protein